MKPIGSLPCRYEVLAAGYFAKAIPLAHKAPKQAVIAPSMLALLYPVDGEVAGYSREQFHADSCAACEKDIRRCFAAGAARVSIDFTEGRLACRNDPCDPRTGRGMLGHFIELNNRVINRFTAAERKNIGDHICPDGCSSRASTKGNVFIGWSASTAGRTHVRCRRFASSA